MVGTHGKDTRSGYWNSERCVKAWAVKRMIASERWDIQMINNIRSTLQERVLGEGKRRIPVSIRMGGEDEAKKSEEREEEHKEGGPRQA